MTNHSCLNTYVVFGTVVVKTGATNLKQGKLVKWKGPHRVTTSRASHNRSNGRFVGTVFKKSLRELHGFLHLLWKKDELFFEGEI